MSNFLDKFLDVDKTSKLTITNPRKVFEDILKQASGSSYTRDIKYNIYYQVIAFYGVTDGIGCSTLVANTALAIAETGLTVCVIDSSILSPVQDVLLNTDTAVIDENSGEDAQLDWFDMPFTRKSPLHISKKNRNISVLSFKGKRRGVVDFLSTNDSNTLVEIALSTLHNKFDLILIDCCHELSAVNTACLQQAQQVIQVWNDAPTVVANLENHITNAITLSCPLDKMRYIVANKISKDAMGTLDNLCKQYRCKLLTTNYLSEELYLLAVTGKTLFRAESTDELVINYTESIIDIVCHILNIDLNDDKPKGTITSNDIMEGKVEGTYHKELKDYNDAFAENHPDVVIDTNPLGSDTEDIWATDEDIGVDADDSSYDYSGVMAEDDVTEEELLEEQKMTVKERKKKRAFGKSKRKKG